MSLTAKGHSRPQRRTAPAPARWPMGVGLTVAIALSGAGCKEILNPPAPKCADGRHVSAGKCCAKGEDWVPARQGCYCLDREVCGGPAQQGSPASAPAAAEPSPPPEHRCVGSWKGQASDRSGQRASLVLSIRPLQAGTVDRPHARSCGTATESWSEIGHCRFQLVRCSQNGNILIATGIANESSECANSSVVFDCQEKEAQYRRGEEDQHVSGKLERNSAP